MTRPTDRTGPAPTDQTIAAALKTWPGGPPTRNRVMAEYGIGATRATRLLDETIPDWRDRATPTTGPTSPNPVPVPRPAVAAPVPVLPDEAFAEIVRDFAADEPPVDRAEAAPVQRSEPARKPRIWGLLVMLYIIAASAGIAIWSGWVGLGGMSGYGPVRPLPGIAPLVIDAAITLPLGMEAYAAIALKVWIVGACSDRTRTYAKRSTIASLVVGAGGQIAYHLLVAFHAAVAPWEIVMVVSVLPVAVLGMAAGLIHLVIADRQHAD